MSSTAIRRARREGGANPARSSRASWGAAAQRPAARRAPTPPNPLVPRLALVAALGGFAWVVALGLTSLPPAEVAAQGGEALLAGTVTGLVGTYLAMLMVLLASRLPAVERAVGFDRLLRWHRLLAPWPILLLVAHAVLVTVGEAQAAKSGFGAAVRSVVLDYPDVLAATVGLAIMVVIGVVSVRAIRRRLRRETWWALHLYLYLALALSFAHAVVLGPNFVGHPVTQAVWAAVWAATAGVVLVSRFGLPLARSLRHQLRVVEVHEEAPGVTSVVLRGRRLDRLPVAGGQVVLWRFLARGLWWQAHPYTLSALPRPPYLRITVRAVGDHSAAVARLRPGTPVVFEGPYGAFTAEHRRRPRVLLVAGGIGVTAVRSLLEDLPPGSEPVVLLRARRAEDLALADEVESLAARAGGRVHRLVGPRDRVRLDRGALLRLVPDLGQRDVYVSGPPSLVAELRRTCRRLGVPGASFHGEAYAL
ncbi:ferredoxin reductase family protein [Aciditerrimonas ferrireducens]|jgi:predicted ferric reductase|uniref:ferredoxin reductase family protein n=1 Tax=Aciditerrimonas ferrireducens TaxID=667306 RepID=UPI002006AB46|nr:ferric reductase-like transmembrane domain-containing protein [Aciditerrimonas ferrireducens]MCK4177363.1 ferric reductase-like transmembrane domain-containing protein [Aciditerrimonas ferrireducens]